MAASDDGCVHIVDHDPSARALLENVVKRFGWTSRSHDTGRGFLDQVDRRDSGCLVIDPALPDLDGLTVLRRLRGHGIRLPAIIVAAHVSLEDAVEAMKGGAIDVVRKPYDALDLGRAVARALEVGARRRREQEERERATRLLQSLTPRESEVIGCVVAGLADKAIASRLGVSQQAVGTRRRQAMHKLGADSIPELVRLVLAARSSPDGESALQS